MPKNKEIKIRKNIENKQKNVHKIHNLLKIFRKSLEKSQKN